MEVQTHKKDFSMQMWNPYRKKKNMQFEIHHAPKENNKCLRRRPDNLLPFNYAASSISTWQIWKDVTSWAELNPT